MKGIRNLAYCDSVFRSMFSCGYLPIFSYFNLTKFFWNTNGQYLDIRLTNDPQGRLPWWAQAARRSWMVVCHTSCLARHWPVAARHRKILGRASSTSVSCCERWKAASDDFLYQRQPVQTNGRALWGYYSIYASAKTRTSFRNLQGLKICLSTFLKNYKSRIKLGLLNGWI